MNEEERRQLIQKEFPYRYLTVDRNKLKWVSENCGERYIGTMGQEIEKCNWVFFINSIYFREENDYIAFKMRWE